MSSDATNDTDNNRKALPAETRLQRFQFLWKNGGSDSEKRWSRLSVLCRCIWNANDLRPWSIYLKLTETAEDFYMQEFGLQYGDTSFGFDILEITSDEVRLVPVRVDSDFVHHTLDRPKKLQLSQLSEQMKSLGDFQLIFFPLEDPEEGYEEELKEAVKDAKNSKDSKGKSKDSKEKSKDPQPLQPNRVQAKRPRLRRK